MDFSSPRVVVTGGFGALGRSVVAHLRASGARVAVLDHAPAPADVAAPALDAA